MRRETFITSSPMARRPSTEHTTGGERPRRAYFPNPLGVRAVRLIEARQPVEQPIAVPLIDHETGEVLERDLVGGLDLSE